jgi:hypothetical protein
MPELNKELANVLADKGRRVALGDPLLTAMRELEPEGPSRLGFDIGIAVGDDDTLWGPGKQSTIDNLPITERTSAGKSAHFVVERNANADFATKGAAVAKVEVRPEVQAARKAEEPGFYTLGFDIAAGIFGNVALGGAGHTLPGPGSDKIRNNLHPEGIRGFDASEKLHMGQ